MKINNSNNWFFGLNSLRFILAFIVLLSHTDVVITTALKHSNFEVLRLFGILMSNSFDGTSAVIAFFLISGFVIHYPNKKAAPKFGAFWLKRFTRILIPLFVIQIIGSFLNHPEKSVMWSLYCELIYYVIYPLLFRIKLTWRSKLISAYIITFFIMCLYGFFHLGALIQNFKIFNINLHAITEIALIALVFFPCWLLGLMIAENIESPKTISFNTIFFYRFIVFAASILCSVSKYHFHVSYSISMNILSLLLYKWLESELNYFRQKIPNQVLEYAGNFSFSLYLCHNTLFVFLALFLPLNFCFYPLFIVLALLGAYTFYLAIEKPSHILGQRLSKKLNF